MPTRVICIVFVILTISTVGNVGAARFQIDDLPDLPPVTVLQEPDESAPTDEPTSAQDNVPIAPEPRAPIPAPRGFSQPPLSQSPLSQPAPGPSAQTAAALGAFVAIGSVPFMIGDTASGSCASVSFMGAIDGNIEHPTFACSRLNISENNTPLPSDRFYFSYRHFHNVSETKVFQFENDLNIDRFTLGAEKTCLDGMLSVEVRVPVARELGSTFDIILDDFDPSRTTVPINDRDGEFGNVSVIGKLLLYESRRFALSTGVAVLIPTAEDVIANGDFFANFEIIEPEVLFAFADVDFDVLVKNETVNVSPFVSWLWLPHQRLFHQGFLQIDVPTNPSDGRIAVDGDVFPFIDGDPFTQGIQPFFLATIPVDVAEAEDLFQQTLLRLNLGFGYWMYKNPAAPRLRSLAALLEVHYTTALEDARLFSANLFSFDFGGPIPVDFAAGNGANRIDIVNLTLGFAAEVGQTTITNGFVLPLSKGDNKAFDMEYNLQVQRRF